MVVAGAGAVSASPAQAERTPATATVSPKTGLADGQKVTVNESGFLSINDPRVGEIVPLVYQCRAGVFPLSASYDLMMANEVVYPRLQQRCASLGQFQVGVTTQQVAVRRVFRTSAGETVQCGVAPGDCVTLIFGVVLPNAGLVSIPISFAPSTPTSCVTSAVRLGPPKQQDVTVRDADGIQAITNIRITNGTVRTPVVTPGARGPLVLTATKTDQAKPTSWSFDVTDSAGITTRCA